MRMTRNHLACLMAFICASLVVTHSAPAQDQPQDLVVRSLTVADSAGRKRITLSIRNDRPQIVLHDRRGRWRVALVETLDGGVVEAKGDQQKQSARILGGEGAFVELLHQNTGNRARLQLGGDGGFTVTEIDTTGKRTEFALSNRGSEVK